LELLELITLGAAVTAALWAVLVVGVVTRKTRRDGRERRALDRRRTFVAAVEGDDQEQLRAIAGHARRSEAAQVDLILMLDGRHPLDDRAYRVLVRAFDASGLSESLRAQTRAKDPVRRGAAALLLGRARVPGAVEWIVPLLTDTDLDVRLTACAALTDAHSDAAAQALIDALESSDIPKPRLIERLASEWASPTVLDTLERGDKTPPTLAALLRAVGLSGVATAAPTLIRYLRSEEAEQRISAARSLGQIGAAAAAPALLLAMKDSEWEVRAQAARALGALRDPIAIPALADALTDHGWWVRANAGNALRGLGEPGLEALRRTERWARDPFARDRARECLALAAATRGGD
jgi:HEAT repeat protein